MGAEGRDRGKTFIRLDYRIYHNALIHSGAGFNVAHHSMFSRWAGVMDRPPILITSLRRAMLFAKCEV